MLKKDWEVSKILKFFKILMMKKLKNKKIFWKTWEVRKPLKIYKILKKLKIFKKMKK